MINESPTPSTVTAEERYIVQGRRTDQVSDSEWERLNKTLIVADDTTVKEIIEWSKKHKLDFHCGLFIWPADISNKK